MAASITFSLFAQDIGRCRSSPDLYFPPPALTHHRPSVHSVPPHTIQTDPGNLSRQSSSYLDPTQDMTDYYPGRKGQRSASLAVPSTSGNATSCPILTHPDIGQMYDIPSSHLDCPNEGRIRVNVCGTIYEADVAVFEKYPDSLLGDPSKRCHLWDPKQKEFYVNGYSKAFEAIFQFYQSGYIRKPIEVPLKTFVEELERHEFNAHFIHTFKRRHGLLVKKPEILPEGEHKQYIWRLFEYPKEVRGGAVVAITSVMFILLSLVCFCIETLEQFKNHDCRNKLTRDSRGYPKIVQVVNVISELFLLETVCIVWFSLEIILRFYACPSRCKFIKDPLNILDLFTIVPYYASLSIMLVVDNCATANYGAFIKILRIVRVFRIFRLTRHSKSLQLMVLAFRASLRELMLCLFIVVLMVVAFGALIYVSEEHENDRQIKTMLDGMWWSIVTLTTVGYGDMVPVTYFGKSSGVIVMVVGVVIIAFPAPIIVSNFNMYYRNETGRGMESEEEANRP